MATSRSAIGQALVPVVASALGIDPSMVLVVATPRFLETAPGNAYAEIILGAQSGEEGSQGWGKADLGITVCSFVQMIVDRAQDEITLLTEANAGLLASIDAIDEAILQNSLAGILVQPFWPDGIEAAEDSPVEGDGWVMQRRHYRCQYTFTYPALKES